MTTSESRRSSTAPMACCWMGRSEVNPQCLLMRSRTVGSILVFEFALRGCEEIDLSDIAGNPSPRPSPRGRGRAVSVTCQCIFFVEWENQGVTCQCVFFVEWKIHVQVTPLDRPLPAGEGWGEGLPSTSVSSISSHPLSEGGCPGGSEGGPERGAGSCPSTPFPFAPPSILPSHP